MIDQDDSTPPNAMLALSHDELVNLTTSQTENVPESHSYAAMTVAGVAIPALLAIMAFCYFNVMINNTIYPENIITV